LTDFLGGQDTHLSCQEGRQLSCHSRRRYHRSTSFTFYEHPIIASKESQRNPGNLALFGIKNARRATGENELIVSRRVGEGLALGTPIRLLNDDLSSRHHAVQPSRGGKLLFACRLAMRQQVDVGRSRRC